MNLVYASFYVVCRENLDDTDLIQSFNKTYFDKIFRSSLVIKHCKKNNRFAHKITRYDALINGVSQLHLKSICKINDSIEDIKKIILNKGPVVALVKIFTDFMYYKKGIYIKRTRNVLEKYHTVIIVGWGVENIKGEDEKYWIIQNDWGSSWGINGFAKVSMKNENFMKITENVYFPNSFAIDIGKRDYLLILL